MFGEQFLVSWVLVYCFISPFERQQSVVRLQKVSSKREQHKKATKNAIGSQNFCGWLESRKKTNLKKFLQTQTYLLPKWVLTRRLSSGLSGPGRTRKSWPGPTQKARTRTGRPTLTATPFVEQNFLFSFPSFLSCLLMATPGRSLNPIWDYFSRDETTAKYTKAFCKGLPWPLGRREFIPMFLYRPLH